MATKKFSGESSFTELTVTKNSALEKGEFHQPYSNEIYFFDLIKQGNIEELERIKPKLVVKGQGILSEDRFRNLQYHFIVSAALCSRYCIDGGLPLENAYTTSDVFIRQMDKLWEQDAIDKLYLDMIYTFAKMMRNLKKTVASSVYVRRAIDYITSHYTAPIKIHDIASSLDLSEKYLSTLFRRETGKTIIEYIEQIRIDEACRILTFTDSSYAEIADQLSFNSHSYFTKVFKKNVGMTPLQYRIKHRPEVFSKNDDDEK